MDDIARAAEVLGSATDVALACHLNPDADALGSMLGLAAFLRAAGTADRVLVPERAARSCRAGRRSFRDPTTWSRSSDFPDAPAVMVTCDCASFDRLGPLGSRGIERRRAHLDRPPPVERRARHDPADRSGGVVHVRDGLPPDRRDGRPDAGRDRRLPVRRARDRHRTVPVRGDHAGDAAHRRRAARAPVRSRAPRAGALRGQRAALPARLGDRALEGHVRARGRPGLDVPHPGRPVRGRGRSG